MRGFVQMVCIFAIGIGAGLVSFGAHLEPRPSVLDPESLMRMRNEPINESQHMTASISYGVGIGLMVFGSLGLIVPWVNKIAVAQVAQLGENSAKLFGTTAIWLSIAVIMTFGVLRLNWTGAAGMSVLLFVIALICVSATVCTAFVYGWKPWTRPISNPMPTTP